MDKIIKIMLLTCLSLGIFKAPEEDLAQLRAVPGQLRGEQRISLPALLDGINEADSLKFTMQHFPEEFMQEGKLQLPFKTQEQVITFPKEATLLICRLLGSIMPLAKVMGVLGENLVKPKFGRNLIVYRNGLFFLQDIKSGQVEGLERPLALEPGETVPLCFHTYLGRSVLLSIKRSDDGAYELVQGYEAIFGALTRCKAIYGPIDPMSSINPDPISLFAEGSFQSSSKDLFGGTLRLNLRETFCNFFYFTLRITVETLEYAFTELEGGPHNFMQILQMQPNLTHIDPRQRQKMRKEIISAELDKYIRTYHSPRVIKFLFGHLFVAGQMLVSPGSGMNREQYLDWIRQIQAELKDKPVDPEYVKAYLDWIDNKFYAGQNVPARIG